MDASREMGGAGVRLRTMPRGEEAGFTEEGALEQAGKNRQWG